MTAARMNGVMAVELDPVRRHDRMSDQRLAAAVTLADRVEIAECLLAGVEVPARRLDPLWVNELRLRGAVVLDAELALRVNARCPLAREAAV